jgi:DNA-directed RNA polymerase specialized sigma24 family protein
MLPAEQLHDAARIIAASVAEPHERPDVYQEAWIRFIRYRPRKFGFALTLAAAARDSLWRRRRKHRRLDRAARPDQPYTDEEPLLEARDQLRRLAAARPVSLRRVLLLVNKGGPLTGAERRTLHYHRSLLRAVR